MQFNRNNFLITDSFFLRITQLKMFGFWFVFLNFLHHCITRNDCNNVVSPVYAVFVIVCWYSIKNEIPAEAVLELCQLKIKQLSLDILKFWPKHKDNPFTLICFVASRSFLFIFHSGSRGLGSKNFRNSSYQEKNDRFGPCFQTIFWFLMTLKRFCNKSKGLMIKCLIVWWIKLKDLSTLKK